MALSTCGDKGTFVPESTCDSCEGLENRVKTLEDCCESVEETVSNLNECCETVQENVSNLQTYKQDALIAGANINIDGNVISATNTSPLDFFYPIGSIYMSVNDTNPSQLFGGEWEKIEDTFLLASGTTYESGQTGGAAEVTLDKSQCALPEHTHTLNHPYIDMGEHSHRGYGGRSFVVSDHPDANNTTVSYNANGNRLVDGLTSISSTFHHYVVTASEDLGRKYTTGGSIELAGQRNALAPHLNMPPYLAVNVWKRTA